MHAGTSTSPDMNFFSRPLRLLKPLGIFVFLSGLVLISNTSHADVATMVSRLIPARQFISAGRQAPRIIELLENNREASLLSMIQRTHSETAISSARMTADAMAERNFKILVSWARRDPISLEDAQRELAVINRELEQLEQMDGHLDEYGPIAQQMLHDNEVLLSNAQHLAEIRLLVAEVHAEGENGIEKVRERLCKAILANREHYRTSVQRGLEFPQELRSSLEEQRRLAVETGHLEQKLRELLRLEIARSGSLQTLFRERGINAALAHTKRDLLLLDHKVQEIRENLLRIPLQSRAGHPTQQTYHAMAEAFEEAKERFLVMEQEAAAWEADLRMPS